MLSSAGLYCKQYGPRTDCSFTWSAYGDPEGGGGGGGRGSRPPPPPPLKNHKIIGFLSNTDPDPLKNHKATKPAFNVGSSSSWRADDGPILVVGIWIHSLTKKKESWTPSEKTFWIRAWSVFIKLGPAWSGFIKYLLPWSNKPDKQLTK